MSYDVWEMWAERWSWLEVAVAVRFGDRSWPTLCRWTSSRQTLAKRPALGAAAVAAVAAGLWDDFSRVDEVHQVGSVTRPDPGNLDAYNKLLPIFLQASRHQARLGDALATVTL